MRIEQDLMRGSLPPRSWPETAPASLRLRLLDALSYRSVTAEDVWDELRDWLDEHGVPVPATVMIDRDARMPTRLRKENM